MKPTIGRTVIYRSRTGNYACAAIITATTDTLWPQGLAEGHVRPLDDEMCVHLHVLTPGAQDGYQEMNVSFSATVDTAPTTHDRPWSGQEPGTWAWPELVG